MLGPYGADVGEVSGRCVLPRSRCVVCKCPRFSLDSSTNATAAAAAAAVDKAVAMRTITPRLRSEEEPVDSGGWLLIVIIARYCPPARPTVNRSRGVVGGGCSVVPLGVSTKSSYIELG